MHAGYIEEEDGFVVEQSNLNVVPSSKARRLSKPMVQLKQSEPLSPFVFLVVWLLLLAFHGLCAAYLLAMAMLYFFMENPLMAYYADLLALPEHRYFRLFGVLVGILGALHGLQLLLHLLWSIKARSPAVFPRAAMVNDVVKYLQSWKKINPQPEPVYSRSRNSLSSFSSFASAGFQDVFSVEGSHFALVFMFRKAAEASAQIVQCHRYSTLIGRVWINRAYVAMVVVNCWITPLLDYLMLLSDVRAAKKASTRSVVKADITVSIRERTLSVIVDTYLTLMACLILPLAIFVPYAQAFDAGWYGFPTEILYGDVSFPNLVRENQALFALNLLDAVTKLVPHISILFGMASLSLILELYPPLKFKHNGKAIAAVSTLVVKAKDKPVHFNVKPQQLQAVVGLTFLRRIVAPLGFVSAGAIVLGIHFHAAHLASSADTEMMKMCLQGLRPWFAENVSCSVLDYNCYKHGVVSPSIDVLDRFQSDAVTAVIFEHCPEFQMPPSIRKFSNLLGLELWNVTIANWGSDAALNADLHPVMMYLVMAYTNMTAIPEGLLTVPLPPLLGDIEISITNLSVIPDELAVAWSNVRLVYLEHAPLKEFPTAFFKIPSLSVSLLDDGLESIPEDLFTTVSLLNEYLEITLSYNPIKELPPMIRDGLIINYLTTDHTNLTELPDWSNKVRQWINLGGCPICNETGLELPTIADCNDWGWNPIRDGRYPIALVSAYRQVE
ncbi:hypothetical protein P3T76_004627 [Phytophthora citrophthora]|uniref:Uncharacterized protein n=1 Tax=Phytophthora citrophthora TaxID=4793 RepID=A0AAD9GS81_9STRA|nr:hypothetical protein P3T76_004627 [Phytophthora citrophthora]